MALLRTLLNLVWLVLAGVWMALGYLLAGIVCCILIITIPWGIASFRIALFALWPFGSRIERRQDAGVGSTLGNVIWIIVAGWWLAIGHIVTGHPAGGEHHRHPVRLGEPQDDPGVAHPARPADRRHR